MNSFIPKELIDRAESALACQEAIIWLRKKPRTWLELVEKNAYWCRWAVRAMADIPSQTTYRETIYLAFAIYDKTLGSACATEVTYRTMVASAGKVYSEAKAKALKIALLGRK
jgi:hypothetical protein